MAHAWYIIHTLSGQEQKVVDSINKRVDVEEMGAYIEEVFVAKEKVVDVRGGEKKVSMKKLFPGYVFIHVNLRDDDHKIIPEPMNFIKDTPGAIGFVGGDQPDPTPDDEIADIKARIADSEDLERPKVEFEVGETVKINHGAFEGNNGIVEEIDPEKGRLMVTVNIFGLNTRVDVD
jgi:transcriptional antiterminator NusG